MSRNADQPTAPAPRTLIDLVRQVADADGQAFARLYHALAPAVAGNLRPTLPDPADYSPSHALIHEQPAVSRPAPCCSCRRPAYPCVR